MNRFVWGLVLLFVVTTSVVASSDDRQKAEIQVRKITAMATDKVGRQLVSMSVADTFKLSRPEMVRARRAVGLDYGSFFVAQSLVASGANLADIAAELGAGKTIWQIGEERHADWKKIGSDAKKQNGRIEDCIYRHFLNKKNYDADEERSLADKYDIRVDAVRTDFNVTPQEMADAQARYIFWRTEAGKLDAATGAMSPNERMAAGLDHTTTTHDTSGGIGAPAAGGLPPH
ncbi:MAG TPA: hypothetical protein VNW47_07005 [Terriglobales bacterium]|jgi:hypothetical protein|nr:hypothetical protein [Terriglobales bacterium]